MPRAVLAPDKSNELPPGHPERAAQNIEGEADMSQKKRFGMLMVAALSTMAAMVAPAQADDTAAATHCALVPGSVAGTTTIGPGVQGVLVDSAGGTGWDPLKLLDIDSGGFTFTGQAVCGGADVAGAAPDAVAPTPVTITANGNYNNLICGTGTAAGTATLKDTATGGANINLATTFSIHFVGGVGTLAVDSVTGTAKGSVNATNNTVSQGNGYGVIDIIPSAGNCVQGTVTAFLVNGAFTAFITG